MVYVALLYEGVGQKLVRQKAANDAEFFAQLDRQFSCYVCLWFTVEQPPENDSTYAGNSL